MQEKSTMAAVVLSHSAGGQRTVGVAYAEVALKVPTPSPFVLSGPLILTPSLLGRKLAPFKCLTMTSCQI